MVFFAYLVHTHFKSDKNDGGNLHARRSMPNQKSAPETGAMRAIQKFELFNVHGHYKVYLSLDHDPGK